MSENGIEFVLVVNAVMASAALWTMIAVWALRKLIGD